MNIKASGRAALIIAAGLCVCIASPVQAAEADGVAVSQAEAAPGAPVALGKFRKSRHWKHASSHRKPVKLAQGVLAGRGKTSEPKGTAEKKTVDPGLTDDSAASSLPFAVANAHAQLADADDAAGNAAALTSQARNRLQLMAASQPEAEPAQTAAADTELVAADQLNEVDRALGESKTADKAPAAAPAMAVAQAAAAASTDDSSWGQASLIGKIFIAFGGLLTLASAARMFMA